MQPPARDPATFPLRVAWSRGPGCSELATALATLSTHQVDANPVQTCVESRADMAVMRSLGSFDLVPVAVPAGLDLPAVDQIVAAVSTGPHSDFAALMAVRLARVLRVPVRAVTAVRPGAPRAEARRRLTEIRDATGLEGDVVEVPSAPDMVASLSDGALIVLGAPGGSWLTRQFFGPGARLRAHAPAGTIVVRDAPRRAYQFIVDASAIGVHTRVGDAAQLTDAPIVPVTEEGRLVGIVRRSRLGEMGSGVEVGDVLEEPPYVVVEDDLESLRELVDFFEEGPIPVVDRQGRFVGVLPVDALA